MKRMIKLFLCLILIMSNFIDAYALEDNLEPVVTEEIVEEEKEEVQQEEIIEVIPSSSPIIDETIEVKNEVEMMISSTSFSEAYQRINSGENMMILMGNKNNQDYQNMLNSFNRILAKGDERLKNHIIMIDSIDDLNLVSSFKEFVYDENDANMLQKVIDDILQGTTGNFVIIDIFEKTITKIISNSNKFADGLTIDDVVKTELGLMHHRLINQPANSISLMAVNGVDEGARWEFFARASLHEFVAPVNGNYLIKLWGADGDSDMGAKSYGFNEQINPHTTGVGGGGGYTEGVVYLQEGQTIYLALGFRNDMSNKRSYNGGGKGFGASYGYRAGGGGAASCYLSEKGKGEIVDYNDYQDQIIMIAGGGGGAEDFYAPSWQNYYCNTNACSTSYGGNGGNEPTGGTSSGAIGIGGGYQFGIGQDYGSYENASSGAGGGGLYGGSAANDTSLVLRGGTGGGGLSYINKDIVMNGHMENGTNVNYHWENDDYGWDDGENAKASIELIEIEKFPLTIHYLDKNTNQSLHEDYIDNISYGYEYAVETPIIEGYSIVDKNQNVIKGIMPKEALEINVYFDYSAVRINYLEKGSDKVLYEQYEERLKTGSFYDIKSPNIEGYELYDDISIKIEGTKSEYDEEYNVYYVSKLKPIKDIIAVNDIPVSKEASNEKIQLKKDDIVTYAISYTNKRKISKSETIEDSLPDSLEYIENSSEPIPTSIKDNSLIWNLEILGESTKTITFKARVKDGFNSIDNWDRKDPFINFEIIKSSNPSSSSLVGYNQEITYNLRVKNKGVNPINNLLVVDAIPENTQFVTVDHNYQGEYVSDKKYVRFIIDELLPDQIAILTFKVKVITKVDNDNKLRIENVAHYDNFNEKIIDKKFDDIVLNNDNLTNVIYHEIVGAKLDAYKSSNPLSNSVVDKGQEITYNIKLTNNGSVTSNYLRIWDDIPEGTTYVENSLSLVSENTSANDKYAINYGNDFDIAYDSSTKEFRIENLRNVIRGKKEVSQFKISYGDGLEIINILPKDELWSLSEEDNAIIITTNNGDKSFVTINDYLKTLRFVGDYGTVGDIKITFYSIEEGIVPSSYKFSFKDGSSENFIVPETAYWEYKIVNDAWIGDWGGSSKTTYVKLNKGDIIPVKINKSNASATITIAKETQSCTNQRVQFHSDNDGWYSDQSASYKVPAGKTVVAVDSYLYPTYLSGNSWGVEYKVDGKSIYSSSYRPTSTLVPGARSLSGKVNVASGKTISFRGYKNGNHGSISAAVTLQTCTTSYVSDPNRVIYGKIISELATMNNSLPLPSSSKGCKYITNNGKPYVECITADLAVGQSATMSFKVKIDEEISSGITEIKNISCYENISEDPGDAGSIKEKPKLSSNTTIHPLKEKEPIIKAIKEADPISGSIVDIKDEILYKIHLENIGNATAKYTVVREYIPENTTYKALSISNDGIYVNNGDDKPYVEWVLYDIPVNGEADVYYRVLVDEDADPNVPIKRYALYDLYHEDIGEAGMISIMPKQKTNETIHTLSVDEDIEENPSITIDKMSNPVDSTAISRDSLITYTLHITNTSDKTTARYILLRDVIPDGTTFVDFKEVIGGSNSPDLAINKEYNDEGYVQYELMMLKPNDSIDVSFEVKVDKKTTLKEINNYASYGVSLEKPQDDKEIKELLKHKTNMITHSLIDPIIEVKKISDPVSGSLVGRNRKITYTLEVKNTSNVLANHVLVMDEIPKETTLIENSIKCSNKEDDILLLENDSKIKAILHDLNPDEIRTISFSVIVNEDNRQGDNIYNIAYYDLLIDIPDKLEDLPDPQISTNEIVHTIEMGVDVLPTGGRGWEMSLGLNGILVLIVGLFIIYSNVKNK